MMLNDNEFVNHLDDDSQPEENTKPVREGQPMGGQKFGENNNTYAGDDKNNPSQNAGYTNEYFRRNEPSEEHPESTNFKVSDQEGAPDYDSAVSQGSSVGENSDTINNDTSSEQTQEGSADNDGKDNPDEPSRANIDPHIL